MQVLQNGMINGRRETLPQVMQDVFGTAQED
jgi:hypothetical protein